MRKEDKVGNNIKKEVNEDESETVGRKDERKF